MDQLDEHVVLIEIDEQKTTSLLFHRKGCISTITLPIENDASSEFNESHSKINASHFLSRLNLGNRFVSDHYPPTVLTSGGPQYVLLHPF